MRSVNKFFYKITHWETWHYLAKYIPISPVWFWYCLRSRSFWFFTTSNPTLTFGGFEGESKSEMYAQLPPGSFPESLLVKPGLAFSELKTQISASEIKLPFIVKPDVGMMGFLFRKIETLPELETYHQLMSVPYYVQALAGYPIEVSVFYYRMPGSASGTITGFLKKEFFHVKGDGVSTLKQLISDHPTARFRTEELFGKHATNLESVIPAEEEYILSPSLNLSRGSKLVSMEQEKDAKLLSVFDGLSNYSKNFFYGRYDIKCSSIEDLKLGKNFTILEFNGSGAEPHHIYGNGYNLFQAYGIVISHWKVLFEISRQNRKNGIEVWSFSKGMKFLYNAKKHFKILKNLDINHQV